MSQKMAKVKCTRFDPKVDKEVHYQTYEVPLEWGMSVLNVLEYIFNNFDPTLAFYVSCRRGYCARCAVLLNGKAVLSCNTFATEDMTIEPIPGKIIRDLFVDTTKRKQHSACQISTLKEKQD